MVEQALTPLGARMVDPGESFASAVEAGKLFAKLGQLEAPRDMGNSAERFTVTINMGGPNNEKITIDQPKRPVESPESIALKAITADTE